MAQDKALAAALREFQRVKDETEISDHKKHFYDDLLKLCIYPPKGPGDAEIPEWDFEVNEGDATYKTGMEKFKHLKAYFKKNWLTPQWIRASSNPTFSCAAFLTVTLSVLDRSRSTGRADPRQHQREQLRRECLQGLRWGFPWSQEEQEVGLLVRLPPLH